MTAHENNIPAHGAKHTGTYCYFVCFWDAMVPRCFTETGDTAGVAAPALSLWVHLTGHGKQWLKGLHPCHASQALTCGAALVPKETPPAQYTVGSHQESCQLARSPVRPVPWLQGGMSWTFTTAAGTALQRKFLTFSLVIHPLELGNLYLKIRFTFNLFFFF